MWTVVRGPAVGKEPEDLLVPSTIEVERGSGLLTGSVSADPQVDEVVDGRLVGEP